MSNVLWSVGIVGCWTIKLYHESDELGNYRLGNIWFIMNKGELSIILWILNQGIINAYTINKIYTFI